MLTPTRIYVRSVLALLEKCQVKAISHITGGGFYENIPRMMKEGLTAEIKKASFPTLPIFDLIQKVGDVPEHDMYNTFNMGIGMAIVVPADQAEEALAQLKSTGETAFVIGKVTTGDEGVILC